LIWLVNQSKRRLYNPFAIASRVAAASLAPLGRLIVSPLVTTDVDVKASITADDSTPNN
jgi:hypothetical protein